MPASFVADPPFGGGYPSKPVFDPPGTGFWTPPWIWGPPPRRGGYPPLGGVKTDSWGPEGVRFYPLSMPLDLLQTPLLEGVPPEMVKKPVFDPPGTDFWTPPEGGGYPPQEVSGPPQIGVGTPPDRVP